MKEARSDSALIFMHIPRTGGGTLNQILRRQYQPTEIYSGGLIRPEELARFRERPLADRARLRLLMGHLRFGIDAELPNPSTYLTLLREPVARVISQYFFARVRPHLQPMLDEPIGDISLREFVESGIRFGHTNNSMTRFIAGVGPLERADVTPALFRQAKENLKRFSVVGLTEHFDESIVLGQQAFGWKRPFYVRRHVADRSGRPRIDEKTMAVIREHNTFDAELYAEVKEGFIENWRRDGPPLERRLKRFRLLNSAFQKSYPVLAPLRWRLKSGPARTN